MSAFRSPVATHWVGRDSISSYQSLSVQVDEERAQEKDEQEEERRGETDVRETYARRGFLSRERYKDEGAMQGTSTTSTTGHHLPTSLAASENSNKTEGIPIFTYETFRLSGGVPNEEKRSEEQEEQDSKNTQQKAGVRETYIQRRFLSGDDLEGVQDQETRAEERRDFKQKRRGTVVWGSFAQTRFMSGDDEGENASDSTLKITSIIESTDPEKSSRVADDPVSSYESLTGPEGVRDEETRLENNGEHYSEETRRESGVLRGAYLRSRILAGEQYEDTRTSETSNSIEDDPNRTELNEPFLIISKHVQGGEEEKELEEEVEEEEEEKVEEEGQSRDDEFGARKARADKLGVDKPSEEKTEQGTNLWISSARRSFSSDERYEDNTTPKTTSTTVTHEHPPVVSYESQAPNSVDTISSYDSLRVQDDEKQDQQEEKRQEKGVWGTYTQNQFLSSERYKDTTTSEKTLTTPTPEYLHTLSGSGVSNPIEDGPIANFSISEVAQNEEKRVQDDAEPDEENNRRKTGAWRNQAHTRDRFFSDKRYETEGAMEGTTTIAPTPYLLSSSFVNSETSDPIVDIAMSSYSTSGEMQDEEKREREVATRQAKDVEETFAQSRTLSGDQYEDAATTETTSTTTGYPLSSSFVDSSTSNPIVHGPTSNYSTQARHEVYDEEMREQQQETQRDTGGWEINTQGLLSSGRRYEGEGATQGTSTVSCDAPETSSSVEGGPISTYQSTRLSGGIQDDYGPDTEKTGRETSMWGTYTQSLFSSTQQTDDDLTHSITSTTAPALLDSIASYSPQVHHIYQSSTFSSGDSDGETAIRAPEDPEGQERIQEGRVAESYTLSASGIESEKLKQDNYTSSVHWYSTDSPADPSVPDDPATLPTLNPKTSAERDLHAPSSSSSFKISRGVQYEEQDVPEELTQEEIKKDEVVQQKIRVMGDCPAGLPWIKEADGYRCTGGSHFLSNEELGLVDGSLG
ncbi:hypothetical protein K474DRAFT_793185 [Panus rudis PR-1116 ss-1]|nr:hypothetical protein K474DRAFT_793185 [Panus rudis PR-1116 ss-1]